MGESKFKIKKCNKHDTSICHLSFEKCNKLDRIYLYYIYIKKNKKKRENFRLAFPLSQLYP